MKKIIRVCVLALCLLTAMPVCAQICLGVKGGANMSKAHLPIAGLKAENRTGWFVGPMAEFTVPLLGLGVDAAALYSQSELALDDAFDSRAKLKTFEVPVNLKWSFGLGSMLGAYVAAGPQFGFNIGNKQGFMHYDLKKRNTSFNIGAGLKLIRHLQLGVNYNFALRSTGSYLQDVDGGTMQSVRVKNNMWQTSLAYLF